MVDLTAWINQYGYAVLFFSLMLELIALPLPGEVLMSYTGFLVFQGRLDWITSIITAGIGSSVGMTIAYWIGFKLGYPFFYKYGYRIHMGPERLEKTSQWFKRYGNKVIFIGYFIPGVRHLTGYFSGINRLPFRSYALYAYLGAFFWVATFISLGKVLGPQWEHFHGLVKKYLIIGMIIAAVALALVYLYRNHKLLIKEKLLIGLNMVIQTFHSLGRVRFLIVSTAIVFLGFFIFMIDLIEGYMRNEFQQFNTTVMFLVSSIFNERWVQWMKLIGFMSSAHVFIALFVLILVWIIFKGKEKSLEVASLLVVVIGGEIFEELLRRVFYQLNPIHPSLNENVLYPFPSEQMFMAVVIYGFAAFLLVRHSEKIWIHIFASVTVLVILALIGLNHVFFQVQYPSDVVAGYVFGGMWLSLNVFVLEMFRLLRKEWSY